MNPSVSLSLTPNQEGSRIIKYFASVYQKKTAVQFDKFLWFCVLKWLEISDPMIISSQESIGMSLFDCKFCVDI